MYKAIDGLLDGLDVTTTDFFRSPHIAPLALDDYPTGEKRRRIWVWLSKLGACPAFGKGIPTYIPAERFTTALMALMQARKNEAPTPPQFQKLASAVQNNVSAAVPKVAGVVAGLGSSQEGAAATTNNPPPALHAAHLFIANTQEAPARMRAMGSSFSICGHNLTSGIRRRWTGLADGINGRRRNGFLPWAA